MAQELVHASPETPAFHEQLGNALVKVERVEEGVKELELAVTLEPENAQRPGGAGGLPA